MVILDFVLFSTRVGFSQPAAQDPQSLGAPAQGLECRAWHFRTIIMASS